MTHARQETCSIGSESWDSPQAHEINVSESYEWKSFLYWGKIHFIILIFSSPSACLCLIFDLDSRQQRQQQAPLLWCADNEVEQEEKRLSACLMKSPRKRCLKNFHCETRVLVSVRKRTGIKVKHNKRCFVGVWVEVVSRAKFCEIVKSSNLSFP